jgi:hypothetical protein
MFKSEWSRQTQLSSQADRTSFRCSRLPKLTSFLFLRMKGLPKRKGATPLATSATSSNSSSVSFVLNSTIIDAHHSVCAPAGCAQSSTSSLWRVRFCSHCPCHCYGDENRSAPIHLCVCLSPLTFVLAPSFRWFWWLWRINNSCSSCRCLQARRSKPSLSLALLLALMLSTHRLHVSLDSADSGL